MTLPVPTLVLRSATFADDEPVYANMPGRLAHKEMPVFGRADMWPGDCIRRPANKAPGAWLCSFPADPRWNLLARETSFAMLNPQHPALQAAGIFLPPGTWGLSTTRAFGSALNKLRLWADEQQMPADFGLWQVEDWQGFIAARAEITAPGSVRRMVDAVRHLIVFSPVLTGVPTLEDPWPGQSASAVAQCPWTDELSTAAIAPEVWWPLLRAAWAYIDRFAPEILARHDHATQPKRERWMRTQGQLDALLEEWLAAPGSRVPINAHLAGTPDEGRPLWATLSHEVSKSPNPSLFVPRSAAGRARRQRVELWIQQTNRTVSQSPRQRKDRAVEVRPPQRLSPAEQDEILRRWLDAPANLIPLRSPDTQTGEPAEPDWNEVARLVYEAEYSDALSLGGSHHRAAARRAWIRQVVASAPERTRPVDTSQTPRVLRAAGYIWVAALTAMRDSEIFEITRGAVTQYYGAPAVASRQVKHDDSRPRSHWWIIEAVAQAIAVAEALSRHDTRVFGAINPALGDGFRPIRDIEDFITLVNANRHLTGLDEIPAGLVRPHMFRKTMAVIAAQEPDGEIALGIQLKHAARRALANRTTLAYGKPDARWAKEFDNQLQTVAAKKLATLLQARRAGQTIAVGPGAARFHAGLDRVNKAVEQSISLRAQIADERLEITLLREEFADLHLGTINHCLWNAPTAECQNQLPPDQRGTTPLLGACQPARCRNSVLTIAHERVWRMEEADLVEFLKKKLSRPLREQAENRLSEIRSTNVQFAKMKESV
ncbi:hypothetical protein ACH4E7_27895 [Kitasatospora sp. NPDC018058]|uniref:hypothetical protein n=1 Tax=Kitasatospora sp. NPDC018058 TaxID=3364025 RepID=UPI0037C0A394